MKEYSNLPGCDKGWFCKQLLTFWTTEWLHLQGQTFQEEGLMIISVPRTTHSLTYCHIPEGLNLQ